MWLALLDTVQGVSKNIEWSGNKHIAEQTWYLANEPLIW